MPVWYHVKEYFDNSSVHGLRYFTEEGRHWIERLFWIIAVSLSCYGTYVLTMASYESYVHHSISFTTETDYLKWNTSFPAISVCEAPDSNQDNIYDYMEKTFEGRQDCFDLADYLESVVYFEGRCRPCDTFCKGEEGQCLPCPTNFKQIAQDVRTDCNGLLSDCMWNGEKFSCCNKFIRLETEGGPCFSVNILHPEPDVEPIMIMNRKTGPGTLSFKVKKDVKVYIHSAENVPYINHHFSQMMTTDFRNELEVIFTVKEIENDHGLPDIGLDRRNCRFPNENPLTIYPYYSYSACVVQCRIDHQIQKCNCTHHLMPHSNNMTCDLDGLVCLDTYDDLFQALRTEWFPQKTGMVCNCKPSCIESEVNIVFSHTTGGTPHTGGTVTLRMHSLPTQRFKRNLVRSNLDLVVSIGGAAGLFLGASLLSVVECFIYFCIRPWSKQETSQQT